MKKFLAPATLVYYTLVLMLWSTPLAQADGTLFRGAGQIFGAEVSPLVAQPGDNVAIGPGDTLVALFFLSIIGLVFIIYKDILAKAMWKLAGDFLALIVGPPAPWVTILWTVLRVVFMAGSALVKAK